MAFSTPPLVATGDLITAADWNTYIRDNMLTLFPFTAAGQIGVASGIDTLGALTGPSAGGLVLTSDLIESLKMKWELPPSMMILGNLIDTMPTSGSVGTSSSTGVAIPDALFSFTLTETSTLIYICSGLVNAGGSLYVDVGAEMMNTGGYYMSTILINTVTLNAGSQTIQLYVRRSTADFGTVYAKDFSGVLFKVNSS